MNIGRPNLTDRGRIIRFKETDANWRAKQQRKQEASTQKLRFQQKGRKFMQTEDGPALPSKAMSCSPNAARSKRSPAKGRPRPPRRTLPMSGQACPAKSAN